jgi:hypothetical protein
MGCKHKKNARVRGVRAMMVGMHSGAGRKPRASEEFTARADSAAINHGLAIFPSQSGLDPGL